MAPRRPCIAWKPRTSSAPPHVFASGAVGVIEATTAAYPGAPERIELVGTLGTAALAGTALSVAYHDGRREEVAADASAGGTGADQWRSRTIII